MNEFIVWDKKFDRFLPEEDMAISSLGFIFTLGEDGYFPRNVGDCTIHNFIGMTDANNKKIYTDSSVLRMTINDEDGEHSHIGYFSFNELLLMYEFKEPLGELTRIWRLEKLQPYSMRLETLDTMQENKLGLIQEKTHS